MLLKLDTWLIKNLYQRLVNITQKPKTWWIEQCSFFFFIAAVLRQFLKPDQLTAGDYFIFLLDIAVCTLFFSFSRSDEMLAGAAQSDWFRQFTMILAIIAIFSALNRYYDGNDLVLCLVGVYHNLMFMSVYYFAACKPPPPPHRKTKLAFNL